MGGFNSRTLGRVRHALQAIIFTMRYVSIHAPWEGCDVREPTLRCKGICFNSRTLGRVRRASRLGLHSPSQFQFTHPGKGATSVRKGMELPKIVSIHAPWEGCDRWTRVQRNLVPSFNSRTLGRVRLLSILTIDLLYHVSIHAPWEGCDLFAFSSCYLEYSFNSRTLGRVRLKG